MVTINGVEATNRMPYEHWLAWVDANIQRWRDKTHADYPIDWPALYQAGVAPVDAANEALR